MEDEKYCPMRNGEFDKRRIGKECEWWLGACNSCAIPASAAILLATNNGVRLKNSTMPQPKSYLEELDDALDDLKTRMF